MVLILVERVAPSLRGELTRWLIQPRTGVFVGTVSALVRDKLWDRVVHAVQAAKPRAGGKQRGAMMIYTTNTEQGFAIRVFGETDRSIEDFEGLLLAKSPLKA
jgi:CRISPR-associated protein Cas2